jgi:argininosuccinate synthase
MEFAKTRGIPVPTTPAKPYSSDRNLLHISYEGGVLEDPWQEPPEDIFTLTASPKDAPDQPKIIEITFKQGDPVAINGKELSPANLLKELNRLGSRNGIGRADIVENRFVGMKSRGVYETPGGAILRTAHIAIESITMDREIMHLRDSLIPKYSEIVYYGFWFSPEMKLLQDMIDQTQKNVSGVVRLELYKGNARVLGRKSNRSLYSENFATFEKDSVFSQKDAEGFIRLNALRLRIQKMMAS